MSDEIIATPFGRFLVNERDLIESTTKAGTLWDGPGFLQMIAKEYAHLREPGWTVLDVGAHVGTFSIWLASKGAWRVVAVEPVPSTMRRLKANLDLNRVDTASVVLPIEVAGYDSRRALYVPAAIDPGNSGGTALELEGHPSQSVVTRCLDDYQWLWRGGLGLIKIDAQGCDGAILHGLEQTLTKYKPAVVFEWDEDLAEAHGYRLRDTLLWLVARGYEVVEWPSQPNNYLAVHHEKGG